MNRAYQEIQRLIDVRALHKKQAYSLDELSAEDIILHAILELVELRDAPSDIKELADVFGCLIHYMVQADWTWDQVEDSLLKKLKERFEEP